MSAGERTLTESEEGAARREWDAACADEAPYIDSGPLMLLGYAAIAELEAENERLRQELVAFMDHAEKCHACGQYDDCEPFWDDEPTPRPTEGGECD